MAVWEVRDRDAGVEVEAPNWMMAIGSAMAELGSDGLDMACLICDVQPDGKVRIYDPRQDRALLVRRIDTPDAAPPAPATLAIQPESMNQAPEPAQASPAPDTSDAPEATADPAAAVAPAAADSAISPAADLPAEETFDEDNATIDPAGFDDDAPTLDAANFEDDAATFDAAALDGDGLDAREPPALIAPPPPSLQMPIGPSAALIGHIAVEEQSADFDASDLAFVEGEVALPTTDGPPEDLAELLFDGGMEVASADNPEAACAAALALLAEFVPAESACVLGAGINDTSLRFLAVTGPSAEDVRHLTVPFQKGIAGFCHTTGADLIVTDAAVDPRHNAEVDASSGYRTRGVLAVALRDSDGDIHGCIELLNPPEAFAPWHLDAATSVAQTLAAYLGPRI
jgi:hypothetical protein